MQSALSDKVVAKSTCCVARSVFAIDAFAPFVTLLCFQRQRGDGTRIQSLQADRLSGLLAVSVAAILDAGEGRIDLGDELALTVAGAQFECAVCLRCGAVGEVGVLSKSSCNPASVSRVCRMMSSFHVFSFLRK